MNLGGRNLSTSTDEELIGFYIDSEDQPAFAELHQRHVNQLTEWVDSRWLFDHGSAEDVVQTAFFNVHMERASYDRSKPFAPWLYRIATNAAINHGIMARRKKRGKGLTLSLHGKDSDGLMTDPVARKSTVTAYIPGEDGTINAEEMMPEDVYEALNSLNEEERKAIVLLIYDNISERDAAAELGVSRHYLRTIVKGAKAKLGPQLAIKAYVA